MELRDFAERVLFSGTLEEKLAAPESRLEDNAPGLAAAVPAAPGRPANLRMRHDGMRAPFPSEARLESEEERGVLLHFFANHELLAAELMALILLRFPGAPAAFRRGLAVTLQEEQEHTRWHIARMQACGIEFGSYPVNGFFWRCVAPVESPADYVTRMSLTFEQANLDYARHYAGIFARLQDEATASLFERIYRDEIGHVGYGLKWFRRWKERGISDWEQYRGRLPYPLSPRRAKGAAVEFNREGRERAGLEASFIDELEVFEQSKGRTPDVYWFNPDAENELAYGDSGAGQRSEKAGAMSRDLETVICFLARRDDVALLRRELGLTFRREMKEAGLALPESSSVEAFAASGRRVARVRPWAWTPEATRLLEPLRKRALVEPGGWRAEYAGLFSKATQSRRETRWAAAAPSWLGCVESIAVLCRSEAALAETADRFFAAGWGAVVCKAPLGNAGRSQLRLWSGSKVPEASLRKLRAWLESQGAVVVEPWYPRALDFSAQFEIQADGAAHLAGFTRLHVDEAGRFRGCSVERDLAAGADAEAARFLHGCQEALREFYRGPAARLLEAECLERGFRGPVGIDAFVYRDWEGRMRLRPVVELNPRHTMGRVTVELARRIPGGMRVVFEIVTRSRMRGAGFSDFPEFARCLRQSAPLEREKTGQRRLRRGSLPLNDPNLAESCLPVLRVGDNEWSPDYRFERERALL